MNLNTENAGSTKPRVTNPFEPPANQGFAATDSLRKSVLEPARYVLLEEFLVREELASLLTYTLKHELDFKQTTIKRSGTHRSVTDTSYRRSRVLGDLGPHYHVITNRILSYLPHILRKLDHPLFTPSHFEAQITASNDGEFYKVHSDNAHGDLTTREITFVLYFYREPQRFSGGNLRIYDSRLANGRYVAEPPFKTIVPQQDQIIFFPSALIHEVLPVSCPSGEFADSRFTLNGWMHK